MTFETFSFHLKLFGDVFFWKKFPKKWLLLAKNWHFAKGLALLLVKFSKLIFQKNALKSRKLRENDILSYFFSF